MLTHTPISTTVFNISRGTTEADLLIRAKIIIWDEAPMGHRHLLEALDRTLRDICDVSGEPDCVRSVS